MSSRRCEPAEEAFVRAFVAPSKQDRILGFLRNDKGRRKVLLSLPHFPHFDSRFAHRIASRLQTPQAILAALKSKQAPDICYVISAHPSLDQTKQALAEVLDEVVGWQGGTILSCVPGRLAYYEGEHRGDRLLLER